LRLGGEHGCRERAGGEIEAQRIDSVAAAIAGVRADEQKRVGGAGRLKTHECKEEKKEASHREGKSEGKIRFSQRGALLKEPV